MWSIVVKLKMVMIKYNYKILINIYRFIELYTIAVILECVEQSRIYIYLLRYINTTGKDNEALE